SRAPSWPTARPTRRATERGSAPEGTRREARAAVPSDLKRPVALGLAQRRGRLFRSLLLAVVPPVPVAVVVALLIVVELVEDRAHDPGLHLLQPRDGVGQGVLGGDAGVHHEED